MVCQRPLSKVTSGILASAALELSTQKMIQMDIQINISFSARKMKDTDSEEKILEAFKVSFESSISDD